MNQLNTVAAKLRKQMFDSGYELVSNYESEFKVTESFFNKNTNHRVCVKIVEEVS